MEEGVLDDKGAALMALYNTKALKDADVIPKRRLRVIFGAGERWEWMIYVSISVMSRTRMPLPRLIMVFATEKREFYSFRYMQQKTMQKL
ncbi:MAG: hypothetical protein ACLTE2_11575 [Eubacteriales bacterium]